MSVNLYMDVHVPYAITAGLRLRGVDVLTAQQDLTVTLDDSQLLDRATTLPRVLVTQDRDFLREGAERLRRNLPFAGIIFGHQADVTIGQCIDDLELIAKVYEPEDLANRIEYLPL